MATIFVPTLLEATNRQQNVKGHTARYLDGVHRARTPLPVFKPTTGLVIREIAGVCPEWLLLIQRKEWCAEGPKTEAA